MNPIDETIKILEQMLFNLHPDAKNLYQAIRLLQELSANQNKKEIKIKPNENQD